MSQSKSQYEKGDGSDRQKTIGGAPTKTTTTQFYDLMDAAQESAPLIPNIDAYDAIAAGPGGAPAAKQAFLLGNSGKFPIRPLPHDRYDTMWKIKQDMVLTDKVSPSRPLPMTEEDIRYIKTKSAAEEYAAFLTWEAAKYDLNDPATKYWFQRVCPSFFDQRNQLIDEQIDLASKYAKIRLRGPASEEDLQLEFLIENGKLQLPTGPIWNPFESMIRDARINAADDNWQTIKDKIVAHNEKVYSKGIFSPVQPVSSVASRNNESNKMLAAKNPYNPSDIRGDEDVRFTGVYGALPPTTGGYTDYGRGSDLGMSYRRAAFRGGDADYRKDTKYGWGNMSGYGYPANGKQAEGGQGGGQVNNPPPVGGGGGGGGWFGWFGGGYGTPPPPPKAPVGGAPGVI